MALKLKKVDEIATPQIEDPVPVVDAIENSNDLSIGTELQGYRIIQKLGSGGMGTVYLADQKSMQRKVALKILNQSVTKDASSVEQFLNEIRNTGQIHHPNIVNAFDAGCENGVYFFAMQYIKGDTLDHILQTNGSVDEITALEITLQIAGALAHVWNKYKMFHRDIKPGNIMYDPDENKAMLMDLGIAQELGEGEGDEECVEGSPFYMSPEQIQGKKLSWTTDLYSLGATLYQLIVGVPPYDDKTIEDILKMHCQADFPEPSERNPNCKISAETVALLEKMMNKSPSKRFASWEDFISELSKLITVLKDYEDNPEKRAVMDAWSLAESKRKKIQQKKKASARITFLFFGVIVVIGIAGYFYAAHVNSTAAKAYLDNGNGAKASKLQEAYEKFKADPSKFEEFGKTLKQAEVAANSVGVSSADSDNILAQVKRYQKESTDLHDNYESFRNFSGDFEKRSKKIEEIQKKLDQKVPSQEDCKLISDLISNLETATNIQKPMFRPHVNQLEKFKSAIVVMKQKSKQNYAKLEKVNREKSEAIEKQSQRNVRTVTVNIDLNDAEEEGRRNAKDLEREKQARLRSEVAGIERSGNNVRQTASSKPVQTAPKKVKLLNGDDALSAIKADTAKLAQLFNDAAYRCDLEAAYNIKINPEYDTLPQTPDIKRELSKLKAEYAKYHTPVAKAYVVWKEINNLDNLNLFLHLKVRKTNLNRSVGKSTLTIAKIVDGKVYFREPGTVSVPFINLHISDKNAIVRAILAAKKISYEEIRIFCYAMGLYDIVYENAPNEEHNKIFADARKSVAALYALAKRKNDIATMNRLERDYGNWKIMKGIFPVRKK